MQRHWGFVWKRLKRKNTYDSYKNVLGIVFLQKVTVYRPDEPKLLGFHVLCENAALGQYDFIRRSPSWEQFGLTGEKQRPGLQRRLWGDYEEWWIFPLAPLSCWDLHYFISLWPLLLPELSKLKLHVLQLPFAAVFGIMIITKKRTEDMIMS